MTPQEGYMRLCQHRERVHAADVRLFGGVVMVSLVLLTAPSLVFYWWFLTSFRLFP